MELILEAGQAGATRARGLAVVIDVFRAFTVSAYALAGGARECLLVTEVADALELAAQIPGSLVSAEVEGRPIPGIPISNSPTMIRATDLRDRTLIQRTSAGTQGVAAAAAAGCAVMAASLVVARATARRILQAPPPLVTLVATGEPAGHDEDHACAAYLAALLRGEEGEPLQVRRRIEVTERYGRLCEGEVPGFPPTDLELALQVDRFDFAMEVEPKDGRLRLRAVRADGGPRPAGSI